jgi:hypothetical protein
MKLSLLLLLRTSDIFRRNSWKLKRETVRRVAYFLAAFLYSAAATAKCLHSFLTCLACIFRRRWAHLVNRCHALWDRGGRPGGRPTS